MTPCKIEPGTAATRRTPATLRRRVRPNTGSRPITDYLIPTTTHGANLVYRETRIPIRNTLADDSVIVLDDDDDVKMRAQQKVVNSKVCNRNLFNELNSSDIEVIADYRDRGSSMPKSKRLKLDLSAQTMANNSLPRRRICNKNNRYSSVDSELDDNDQVISIEMDDNNDIQIVSDNNTNNYQVDKSGVPVPDKELVCVDEDDDCCLIPHVNNTDSTTFCKQNRKIMIPPMPVLDLKKSALQQQLFQDGKVVLDRKKIIKSIPVLDQKKAALLQHLFQDSKVVPDCKKNIKSMPIPDPKKAALEQRLFQDSNVVPSSVALRPELPDSVNRSTVADTVVDTVVDAEDDDCCIIDEPDLVETPNILNENRIVKMETTDTNVQQIPPAVACSEQIISSVENVNCQMNSNASSLSTSSNQDLGVFGSAQSNTVPNIELGTFTESSDLTGPQAVVSDSATATNNDSPINTSHNSSQTDDNISNNNNNNNVNHFKNNIGTAEMINYCPNVSSELSSSASTIIYDGSSNCNESELNSSMEKGQRLLDNVQESAASNTSDAESVNHVEKENGSNQQNETASTDDSFLSNRGESTSNGKIPRSCTLNIIGKFLQRQNCFDEIFCYNLNRRLCPIRLSPDLEPYMRAQTKRETSLYTSCVTNIGNLGIDVSGLNSLSVLGGNKAVGDAGCNHITVSTSGNCVNCHVYVDPKLSDKSTNPDEEIKNVKGRGSIVDENDVEVVINSLMWLRLGITALHYPDPELLGDMLARYVIKVRYAPITICNIFLIPHYA